MVTDRWAGAGRALAWIAAAGLLGAAALFAYLEFVPPERGAPSDDFVENVLQSFEVQQGRWPIEMISTLLFALGILAFGALGLVLRQVLGRDDPRSAIAGASLMAAGAIGAISQLMLLGARQLTVDPSYCDCNYIAEEVIGRLQAMDLIGSALAWLVYGVLFLAAIGLVLVAMVTLERGPLDRRWAWLSLAIAAINAITIVAGEVGPSEVWSLLIALSAGILTPVWAVWLALQLRDLPNANARAVTTPPE